MAHRSAPPCGSHPGTIVPNSSTCSDNRRRPPDLRRARQSVLSGACREAHETAYWLLWRCVHITHVMRLYRTLSAASIRRDGCALFHPVLNLAAIDGDIQDHSTIAFTTFASL